jgi:dihydroxy-acid dehydratase
MVDAAELDRRRQSEDARRKAAFTPDRDRSVSDALKVYARFAASADKGAVRILSD